MSADPDFIFQYEYKETMNIITKQTDFNPRAHSNREFLLAEACFHQPRAAGRTNRPDLQEARAKTNTEL